MTTRQNGEERQKDRSIGWIDGWMDGRMDGWTDGLMDTVDTYVLVILVHPETHNTVS